MNNEQIMKFAASTAIIAAVFTALVALLMLINYYRFKAQDPLELESLNILVERLKDEPNNDELREEIRDLDLLARKAFFTNQWQVKTGRYLLLFGGIVWIFAMRFYYSARSRIEEPETGTVSEVLARKISQRWIVIAGSVLLAAAFIASFSITDHLANYQVEEIAGMVSGDEESIEVIRITDDTEGETAAGESTGDAAGEQSPAGEAASPEGELSEAEPGKTFASEIRENHNGFRGPLGNGVSYHENLPVDWDGATGQNIKWKITLPRPGFNSPVIWGNRLFVAGANTEGQAVYCIDINTGDLIWQKEITNISGSPAQPPRVTDDTGLSAPTMTTDGIRVYVLFGTGDIAALNMDGTIVWSRNLGVPDNHYGHSSSLITWTNRILIQYDSNRGGRILSLNTQTGDIGWDKGRNAGISWASPILAEIEGSYQLILNSAPIVAGYDPETGDELWSHDCMMGEVGPSPAFGEGLVFAANEYARLVAIKPGTQPTVVWEDDEYLPEVASPVVSGGLLYIATSYGVLVCYDANSGEKYWEEEFNHGFYASPMVADGKLYAMDMGGNMHIYRVSKEKTNLGTPALGETIVTTPAFSEGRIYLRGDDHLYCIEAE